VSVECLPSRYVAGWWTRGHIVELRVEGVKLVVPEGGYRNGL
jgi:hypothetical protein